MSIPFLKCIKQGDKNNNQGFSLIEVMVVMIIVAIPATGVVFMFANPTAKVKAEGFQMLGNFNLARSEAVGRNQNTLVQFLDTAQETCDKKDWDVFKECFSGGTFHGYVICLDEDGDNDCENEVQATAPATPAEVAEVAEDLEEKIIKTIIFKEFVKYYEIGGTPPTDGPSNAPNGDTLTSNNGITFGGDYFSMVSNGTSSDTGTVVIYYPDGGAIRGKPYALVMSSVGNMQLFRWRPERDDDAGTPQDERWSRK